MEASGIEVAVGEVAKNYAVLLKQNVPLCSLIRILESNVIVMCRLRLKMFRLAFSWQLCRYGTLSHLIVRDVFDILN